MSFEEALRVSEELLQQLEENSDCNEARGLLQSMLGDMAGCRGFFVTYLTGDSPLADEPPGFFIEFMKASPHAAELLAKNLVMSTCMKLSHERKAELQLAEGSALVAKRSALICRLMKSDDLKLRLKEMRASLKTKAGIYADFIRRWNYDDEQLSLAAASIAELLDS
ncbi:MAG: hypothetical protein K2X27_15680 [Candidatus Obscuribacterales bacterium]|nr:hypothetical protein [Candidatus Obscuribacterales bacterium]